MWINESTKRPEVRKHSDLSNRILRLTLASWLGLFFNLGALFGVLLCWLAWRLPCLG